MMIKNYLAPTLSVITIGLLVLLWLSMPRIAYVDSYQILEEYEGMKEAQSIYKTKLMAWHTKSDSLQGVIENDISLLTDKSSELSVLQENEVKRRLQQNQYTVQNLNKSIDEFITSEGQNLSDGLLSQIDQFIQKYGKDNKYDLILSNSESGNVLYRKHTIDITEALVEELNKAYFDNE